MKVKICGLTNLEDALLCESLGANAIGFVFYNKSKRYIEPSAAKDISNKLSAFTAKVGVFVNCPVEEVNRISEIVKLNIVQLHGEEKPDIINNIFLPVIKSFRIKEGFDFSTVLGYQCSNYLFDSFSEKEYGGTGYKFNWDLIPESFMQKAIIAGGVNEDNVELIYKLLNPYGVDVSSSLEKYPGKKDENKVKNFLKRMESINQC